MRARRAAHDVAFAAALAAHTGDDPGVVSGTHAGVRHLEDLLPEVILPLARTAPVLLLVLDGMSAGVGTEVIASVLARTGDGWAEALLPGQSRRAAALAVLPTLTEVSRASLLCGELRAGGQDVELRGYQALTGPTGCARPCSTRSRWTPPGSGSRWPTTWPRPSPTWPASRWSPAC